jgi:CAAX prenyl protease-like protein
MGVELKHFDLRALVVTSLVFGFAHHEWLAGIVCGLIYQGLVLRKGRLGDAMTAHAITNFLLGVWVIYRGAWHFW